jgi:hypothetical protein
VKETARQRLNGGGNCWEFPFPRPMAPEVLGLYRKRAEGTSLRSGRDAARRAFDTAT